jgi:hypothetical protein
VWFGAICIILCGAGQASAALLAYEGFDYPNDSPALEGRTGGFGWTAPWSSTTSPLNLTQDDLSLDSPTFQFEPVGDRVFSSAGTQGIGVREFAGIDMAQDGNVLYASFLIKKDGDATTGTGGNNLEVDLGVNGGQQTRFGSTSGNTFFLTAAANATGTVVLGDTYLMVMKLTSSAATPDLVQASFFGPSDAVPAAEPATWALTHNPNVNAVINTARLWVGTAATGAIDELRLGTTWQSVTAIPEPATAILLALAIAGTALKRQNR